MEKRTFAEQKPASKFYDEVTECAMFKLEHPYQLDDGMLVNAVNLEDGTLEFYLYTSIILV